MTKPGVPGVAGVSRKAAGRVLAASVGLLFLAENAAAQSYSSLEACLLDDVLAESECRRLYGPGGVYDPDGLSTVVVVAIAVGIAAFLLIGAFLIRRRRRGGAKEIATDVTHSSVPAAHATAGQPQPEAPTLKPGVAPLAATPDEEQIEVNKAGIGLAVAGAVLLIVASFLPQLESPGIVPIQQNTLAQSGEWIFIGLAVITVAATYRVSQQRTKSFAPLVIGAVAIGLAVYDGTGDRLELVDAVTEKSLGIASPGVGIYAAGIGGALIAYGGLLLAGWNIWPGGKQAPARRTRTCPDCAETVLADARVCKHCGYRLDAPSGG